MSWKQTSKPSSRKGQRQTNQRWVALVAEIDTYAQVIRAESARAYWGRELWQKHYGPQWCKEPHSSVGWYFHLEAFIGPKVSPLIANVLSPTLALTVIWSDKTPLNMCQWVVQRKGYEGGKSETYKPGMPANKANLLIQCPWHRLAEKKENNFQETKHSQEGRNSIPFCQWQQKAMLAKLDQSGSWYKPYTMRQRTKTEGKFLRKGQQISMHLNTTLH